MQDLRNHLCLEVLLVGTFQHTPHRLSFATITSWVPSLRDKSRLDCVEQIEIVIFQLAQLDEVEASFRSLLDEQVDGDVAKSRLNNDRHI